MYGAPPPPSDAAPTQLPAISVEGAEKSAESGYKADQSSLGKLTEPLLNTPFTVETVTRQLMDDQGVTTLREALRNVPGISLAAGEGASQGDSLTIRGFTARNDIFLDGMRDFGSYYRDPFYLQDIQVLKGPASIMFGRGSTGGIVEQDSKLPTLSAVRSGTFVFGSDLTARATADVNQPVPASGRGRRFAAQSDGQPQQHRRPRRRRIQPVRHRPEPGAGIGDADAADLHLSASVRIRPSRLRAALALYRAAGNRICDRQPGPPCR